MKLIIFLAVPAVFLIATIISFIIENFNIRYRDKEVDEFIKSEKKRLKEEKKNGSSGT